MDNGFLLTNLSPGAAVALIGPAAVLVLWFVRVARSLPDPAAQPAAAAGDEIPGRWKE
jgi:hypothetical protein